MTTAKQYFTKLDVASDGPDVHLDLVMTPEQILKIRSEFGGMLGSLTGP
jgi:hypothetical protein